MRRWMLSQSREDWQVIHFRMALLSGGVGVAYIAGSRIVDVAVFAEVSEFIGAGFLLLSMFLCLCSIYCGLMAQGVDDR